MLSFLCSFFFLFCSVMVRMFFFRVVFPPSCFRGEMRCVSAPVLSSRCYFGLKKPLTRLGGALCSTRQGSAAGCLVDSSHIPCSSSFPLLHPFSPLVRVGSCALAVVVNVSLKSTACTPRHALYKRKPHAVYLILGRKKIATLWFLFSSLPSLYLSSYSP